MVNTVNLIRKLVGSFSPLSNRFRGFLAFVTMQGGLSSNGVKTFRLAYRRHGTSRACSIFCLLTVSSFYFTAATNTAGAATYYCDPVNGNTVTGDGSSGNPWGTLESVFDAGLFRSTIQGGNTVGLFSGYPGIAKEYGYDNSDYITLDS